MDGPYKDLIDPTNRGHPGTTPTDLRLNDLLAALPANATWRAGGRIWSRSRCQAAGRACDCAASVRREGVTAAALRLQQAGLIHYKRGHITVLDRAGLEARVCECYAVVRREYDRLLPEASRRRPRDPSDRARHPAFA